MRYRLSSGGTLTFSAAAGMQSLPGPLRNYAPSARSGLAAHVTGRQIGGYATRFNKVHFYEGNFDVLEPGVFARSLAAGSTVRFLEDHDEARVVAFSHGGGLHLSADDVGLAFTLDVPETDAGKRVLNDVRSGRKAGMSVKYRCEDSETRTIAGQPVRIIVEARLLEISLVKAGAVAEAYAEVVEAAVEEPRRQTATEADYAASMARMHSALRAMSDHFART